MPRNSVTSNQPLRPFKSAERRLASGRKLQTTPTTSRRMAKIRQSGTAPEILVRSALSGIGYRYRLRNRDLPGSPDIANRLRKWAVFVHGCYWHHHADCPRATIPKSNRGFWRAKFAANRKRDADAERALVEMGFRVVTIWGCACLQPSIGNIIMHGLRANPRATMRGACPNTILYERELSE